MKNSTTAAREEPAHDVKNHPLSLALLVLASLAATALGATFLATNAGGSWREAAAGTVNVRFRLVDGDSGAPMAKVELQVRDQDGTLIGQGTSDTHGTVIITGLDASATITANAAEPKKYVTFPITKAVSAIGDNTVDVPLYRDDQQWLGWGRSADRRRVGPAAGKPTKKLWTADPQNNMEFPPSLAYGLVVYCSYHGFVVANDQKTGREVWRGWSGKGKLFPKYASQVAVSTWKEDGVRLARVYYTDLTGLVGCRDLFTGKVIWERRSGEGPGTGGKAIPFRSFEASPLVRGESVYVCTRYDKRKGSRAGLWALDRRTGEVRWFQRLARTRQTKIGATPAYRGGRIYVATYDGYVYALKATDSAAKRKVYWRRYLGGQFYSTPAVTSARIYVGNKSDGRLYCLMRSNGRLALVTPRLGPSIHGSPAISDGKVFIGSGKSFYALSARNGRVVWRQSTKGRVWGSASVLRDVVYYSCYGVTYGRKARTGALVWKKSCGRYSPVTATRHLIVVTGQQRFTAYAPAN